MAGCTSFAGNAAIAGQFQGVGALVCEGAAASFLAKSMLPPPIRVNVVRSVDRFGWFVARDAFGVDLYEHGRNTLLRRELLGSISAQRCLEEAWTAARKALGTKVTADDLEPADRAVTGAIGLPLESSPDTAPPRIGNTPDPPPIGLAMEPVDTPMYTLVAAAATWDFVVFGVPGARTIYLSVPVETLGGFLAEAVVGAQDARIAGFAHNPNTGRVLRSYAEAQTFALWDGIEFGPQLAPPERGVDGTYLA